MGATHRPERSSKVRTSTSARARARAREYAGDLTESLRDELFQGILDNVNAVIHIKDADGRYLLVNREFERIRSLKAEEILGRNEDEIGPRRAGQASQSRRSSGDRVWRSHVL